MPKYDLSVFAFLCLIFHLNAFSDDKSKQTQAKEVLTQKKIKGNRQFLLQNHSIPNSKDGRILYKVDLQKEKLNLARLRKAHLAGANLTQAELVLADLREANLEKANLHKANLSLAQCQGANLCGAKLTHADLTGTKLHEALFDLQTDFTGSFYRHDGKKKLITRSWLQSMGVRFVDKGH